MSRTVIYRSAATAPTTESARAESTQPGIPGTAPVQATVTASPAPPVDDYKDKLVKFVPAEVVAFFAPIASLVRERPALLIFSALLGLIATPAYLWVTAKKLDPGLRPPLHNYVLSTVAFGVWALATSDLGAMVHMDPVVSAFTLGATVFLVPLIDSVLSPGVVHPPAH